MGFNALVVEKDDAGKTQARVQELNMDQLPEGNVTVAVDYSTVNYKDGLCIGPGGGLVRNYPHVPGIDMAGTVEQSSDARFTVGAKVVLTGWRYGEVHWGGYAQKTRVNADWLVPLPEGLTTKQAMAVGTAGFTAMLSVMALEDHGLTPDNGPVLVTGAAGGVGSVATAILANLGYEVAAVTGRPEAGDYLNWAMQLTPAPTRYSIFSHGALSCKYDRSYGYVHAPVTHAASISGDATPLTHRVASLLKRWWLGTHQGAISPEHLAYYLDEFTFRFNRRTSRSRGKLFYRLIEQALQINPVPAKTIIHNI